VCRKSKWFSSYQFRTSAKSQEVGGGTFPVVIVNQRIADGPWSRHTGLFDVSTLICCCRTPYICSKLSGIFLFETSAVCQNLWTYMRLLFLCCRTPNFVHFFKLMCPTCVNHLMVLGFIIPTIFNEDHQLCRSSLQKVPSSCVPKRPKTHAKAYNLQHVGIIMKPHAENTYRKPS
jgi:hypothetical protein